MEIIKKEEGDDMLFHSAGRETAISTWIKMLEVGEVLKISKSEWKGKQAPYYIANYVAKKSTRKFKNGHLAGFDGWVIKRIE